MQAVAPPEPVVTDIHFAGIRKPAPDRMWLESGRTAANKKADHKYNQAFQSEAGGDKTCCPHHFMCGRAAQFHVLTPKISIISPPSLWSCGAEDCGFSPIPLFHWPCAHLKIQMESISSMTLISGFPARIGGNFEENSLKCGVEEWKSRAALSL